jgi:hypothetical protein
LVCLTSIPGAPFNITERIKESNTPLRGLNKENEKSFPRGRKDM